MRNDSALLRNEEMLGLTQMRTAEKALSVIGELPVLIVGSGKSPDHAIDESLSRIGKLVSASRVYVMLDEKDGKYLRNTHEWVCEKIGPAVFSWPLYDYEYDVPSLKKIMASHEVFFSHTRDLPKDMATLLAKQGVKTFIVAPIMKDNVRIGLVGMDFCDDECEVAPEYSSILSYLSGLIALALERKHYHMMRGKLRSVRDTVGELEPLLDGLTPDDSVPAVRPSRPTTLLDAERRIIIETLEMYNGNRLKTAKHLGLTWPSLDRRCKKLDIEVRRK